MAAEFGKPQWTFSMVTYAIVDANRIAATYTEGGRWKLALIDVDAREFTPIDLPIEPLESIKANAHGIYFIGGSPTESSAIVALSNPPQGGHYSVLRSAASESIPREWISVAEAVTFKAGDRDVHAFYYPPKNPEVAAPRRATRCRRSWSLRMAGRPARRPMCSIRRSSSGPAAASRCST